MIQNLIIGTVRTYVPIGVGFVLTYLAEHAHIVIDENTTTTLSALSVALVSAAYYALVRLLEHRWPQFGVLLGVPAKPRYPTVTGGDAGEAVVVVLLTVIAVAVLVLLFHGRIR